MVPALAHQEAAAERGAQQDGQPPPRVRMRLGMYFYAEEERRSGREPAP